MNATQRSLLVNLNRVLILALTLTGLLMDGFQRSDLACAVALLVWLWLPLCTRMEARLLGWIGRLRGHVGSARVSPPVFNQTSRLTSERSQP